MTFTSATKKLIHKNLRTFPQIPSDYGHSLPIMVRHNLARPICFFYEFSLLVY